MFPRLLSLTDERHAASVTVESKGYIIARMGKQPRATHVYWELVDPVFSLLEIGFELESGRLVDVSVPLFNGEVATIDEDLVAGAEHGTPHFDTSPWPVRVREGKDISGNVLQFPGRIQVAGARNGLKIVAREGALARRVLYADKVACDFDAEDQLLALGLIGKSVPG